MTYSRDGRPRGVQGNILDDTVREVASTVRLVPLRVIIKAILALIERGQDPWEIVLDFSTIQRMFNTPAIFQNPTPPAASLLDVIDASVGQPGLPGTNLGYFKRNFHILEQTGLLRRTADRNAIQLQLGNGDQSAEHVLRMCRAIAESETFYRGFEGCADSSNLRGCVRDSVISLEWGAYFDGGNLPVNILNQLTGISIYGSAITAPPPDTFDPSRLPNFPPLVIHNPTSANPRPAPLVGLGTPADPEQTRVLREKANRSHARIVQLLSSTARAAGFDPTDNLYIDLCFLDALSIVEVKSCNEENMLSQVRSGVSQLYEYRFRSGLQDAILCLALEQEPSGPHQWLVGYLLEDRGIYPLWVIGDVTLDGPPETKGTLPFLFP